MYFIRMGKFAIVGSSPEMLVRVEGQRVETHPIAGTRPRGRNEEEDLRLADELKRNEKERAEHVMLVDLGRNDLGRVCEYGSVRVPQYMGLERYSHVMHLVSTVEGRLADTHDHLDALVSCFPAGTVSGAPKIRAMQILSELEPTRRDLYAGAVGYIDFAGNLDFCIAIRTITLRDGVARVQAGAGIVADSNPAAEYEETRDKARALLQAIEMAETGRAGGGPASANEVLLLDNYDSFTYNLAQYLGELGHAPAVHRNDEISLGEVEAMRPDRIVISPGPGRPEDAGITIEVIRRLGQRMPVLGVCLGHQGIGYAFGGEVVRAPVLMHGKVSSRAARRPRRFRRRLAAVRRRPLSLADRRRPAARRRSKISARTDDGIIMGLRHRAVARCTACSFIPESVLTGEGTQDPAQFPGAGSDFPALIDKLQRRVDLTVDEASGAMETIMDGQAQPSQIAGLLVGLAMKGERPDEIVGLARTMRAQGDEVVAIVRAGVRHLRHRRRRRAHLQRLDGRGAGARGVRRARREARQPQRVEPLRQRRPVRGARRQRRGAASRRRALPRTRPGIAFLFAQVFHPSMRHAGPDAQGARRAHRVQPARTADQSRRRGAAARRRSAARS